MACIYVGRREKAIRKKKLRRRRFERKYGEAYSSSRGGRSHRTAERKTQRRKKKQSEIYIADKGACVPQTLLISLRILLKSEEKKKLGRFMQAPRVDMPRVIKPNCILTRKISKKKKAKHILP